ncbi:YopX family protein [Enterococcus sp.]|uniref:YopX family protein n=1 Tax=Enterococcus sp. TaxID=35783 RepID=UPI00289CB201|nr:YopX family protein [Enterococcus sp.]
MVPRFRCWDERVGLTEVVSIDFFRKKIKINHWEYGDSNFFPLDEVVLMQSTGLKDKNSVEIFEGDVVKVSDGGNEEDSYISVVKNYADEGYPAFDIEAPSSWYYESNVLSTIMGGDYETIEVIGNVWEDGDLINDSEGAEEN